MSNTPAIDFAALFHAQATFCDYYKVPHFAPRVCYSCGRDVYAHPRAQQEAATAHITGCYHCHRSFCD